jgi:UDPglucose--hexose-1-phosphate uridylyltransferase
MRERRYDPVDGEWRLLVDVPSVAEPGRCPLCPTRPGGPPTDIPLPAFEVVVVEDRPGPPFAGPPPTETVARPLYEAQPALGASETVVHADHHATGLAELGVQRIEQLVHVWADRYARLGRREDVRYVLVAEDRCQDVVRLRRHPHSRVHGYPDIPPRAREKLDVATAHLERCGRCVLCDVVAREQADGVRVVAGTDAVLAFVPFAGRFPYEVHVVPRRHVPSLLGLADSERRDLATVLERVLCAYDRLSGRPLPTVMSMHQAPTDDEPWLPVSHLQVELVPDRPDGRDVTRTTGAALGAGIHAVGIAPEWAAAELREALAS